MRKAIIVLAHQLPEQLNMLLTQLISDRDMDVYIHINKTCEAIIPQIMKHDRIFISRNNIAIHWGSDEILKAILLMYREVLHTQRPYEFILLCSGQDLLVRPGLDEFLEANRGVPFIGAFSQEFYDRYNKSGTLYKWPEFLRRNYENRYHPFRIMRGLWRKYTMHGGRIGRKKIGFDLREIDFSYYNHAWPALPTEVVEYMLSYIDNNPEYMRIWDNAFDPEEMFFSIFLMNSPYSDRIVFHNNWSKSLLFQYKQNGYENHPPILRMKDIGAIKESGAFFARKFDMRVDSEIVDYYRKIVEEKRI